MKQLSTDATYAYVVGNRTDFVLKPTNVHAGAGVVAGWTCTDAEWGQAVRGAVDGPFIVQRRVRAVIESFRLRTDRGASMTSYSMGACS